VPQTGIRTVIATRTATVPAVRTTTDHGRHLSLNWKPQTVNCSAYWRRVISCGFQHIDQAVLRCRAVDRHCMRWQITYDRRRLIDCGNSFFDRGCTMTTAHIRYGKFHRRSSFIPGLWYLSVLEGQARSDKAQGSLFARQAGQNHQLPKTPNHLSVIRICLNSCFVSH